MRSIEETSVFRRDYKREARGQFRSTLRAELAEVVTALANDRSLELRHRNHALTGNWKDHFDCHLRPDLILIYRKPDDSRLQLVRLGSHCELGL